MVTPRESAVAALERGSPSGLVPHCELEYQLSEQWPGQKALRDGDLKDVTGVARQDLLKRNAEMWIRIAEHFRWSIITGLHWLNVEDQLASFEYVRELSGDTYMLSCFVDGTFGIPNGQNMMEHVIWLTEQKEEALAQAQGTAEGACAMVKTLIEGGAEVCFMCADYCFNDGPFLSPPMFATYVTPYLKQLVYAIHEAGGYAVKHTDGQIMPILDQLVSTGIDGLHSLDPMAGVDIAEVKRLVGDQVCLLGNVNCAVVQTGPHEEIEASARYCLEHGGAQQGGYIYTTSNCIFFGVPLANYEKMLAVREKCGYA